MNRDSIAGLVLLAAIAVGVSYLFGDGVVSLPVYTLWKGGGVGLLAVYAALRARSPDGWLICAVMAMGALGDVLIETSGMIIGAVAFLTGHLIAILLYARNRRPLLSLSQAALAIVLVPAVVITAYLLPSDRGMALPVAFYATGLALMASSAWISRFPRYWTGLGAILFVISDLLIFARGGPLAGQKWTDYAVWGLYFAGQTMICVGVTRALAERDRVARALST